MTSSEELAVDAHVLEASNLRVTSRGYNALKRLLSTGNLLSKSLGEDYGIFVDFTKVLDYLPLEYQFVPFGLELKEHAKIHYLQNMMNSKIREVKQSYNYKPQQLGKEERPEASGWTRTREKDV
ncbi:hypothetical protein SGQ83_01450 [Flavobacterium sp. Fl-318]|uniref:Uncharacterized protein n=1 Tax=Flavobacterium cupriresistens TaxID=2893885 RepID=A0ABU4R5Y2_9FLAO|nr:MULTISPECIES: hypothetical protein [unclassified Flavobacterium]MDX6188001.1 hypothetical protein [Flavobacterium sp. Fl-318]UFH42079.1 hypothetical protein LNP23_20000 [Flavobacterium sp. F-323]